MALLPLSNYSEVIPYNGQYAVFNKVNGALIMLPQSTLVQDESHKWWVNSEREETVKYLKESLFVVDDAEVQARIRKLASGDEDYSNMQIEISVTELCNCQCKYCYQCSWDKTTDISGEEYTEWIMRYIYFLINRANENSKMTITYFGGEPLLYTQTILEMNSRIEEAARKSGKKIAIYYVIDSNCTLLTREFLLSFSNVTLCTTLSLPEDHNLLRSNSFRKVFDNLTQVADLFDQPQYQLIIGYNVHHGNVSEFPEFLKLLSKANLKCKIDAINIMNFPNTQFINNLSRKEFENVFVTQIAPCLAENGFDVQILPPSGLSRKCRGTNPLNRKLLSNGTQTLCSYFDKRRDRGAKDYPAEIMPMQHLPPLPDQCIQCYDFPYCGGIRPCVECSGQYQYREEMLARIRCYLEIMQRSR